MMIEPKLRFKADDGSDFPDWESSTVGELFTFVTEKNESGCIGDVITNSAEYGLIPQREYFDKDIAVEGNTEGYTVIHKGDFVYNPRKSTIAPFGPFNIYARDEAGIVSPLYTCLTPRDGKTAPYLSWYFKTSRWHRYIVTHGAQGGARHDRVGMTNILMKGIPITLPSLPEQRKIAGLLSTVDDVIAAQEAEVAAWEKRKKGVMQKLFRQEVRFKADDGSEFPEWEEKTLGDLGRLRNGYAFKSDTYVPHGKYRVITIANVQGERYVTELERANTVNQIPDNIASWQILKESDILISLTGNIGRVSLNTGCDNLLNQRVGLFEVFSPISDRQWVFQRLSANDFRNAMEGEGQGAAQKNISRGDVESFPLSVPSLPEQRKIADCLTSLDDVIAKAKDELDAWRELKKGLLQQMFV